MALIGQKLAYPFNRYGAKTLIFRQPPHAVPPAKSQEVLRRNGV